MNRALQFRLFILFLLLGGTVGCDQTSKHVARTELRELGSVEFPGGFGRLQLAANPGSFLSLGDSLSSFWRRCLFTFGAGAGLTGLLIFLAVSRHLSRLSFAGLTLILAGGLGNLIDRVTQDGLVTDFIFLCAGPFHTGIFNLADLMIVVGSIIVIVSMGRSKSPPNAAAKNQLDNAFRQE